MRKIEPEAKITFLLPLETESVKCLFGPLVAKDKPQSSSLILLFFFGWISSKSSSNQLSATYSSSGTSADLLLEETAGVLENWACDMPWRRDLALPKPRMALWYSSRSKTDATGGALALSRAELASLFGGISFWLVAAGKLCLGRTGRRGLTQQSMSLSSEELLLLYMIKCENTLFINPSIQDIFTLNQVHDLYLHKEAFYPIQDGSLCSSCSVTLCWSIALPPFGASRCGIFL